MAPPCSDPLPSMPPRAPHAPVTAGRFVKQQRRKGWTGQSSVGQGARGEQRSADQQALRVQRTPRHSGIFEAIRRLDATVDQAAREELSAWIRDQYQVNYGNVPVGFVSECFLG